METSWFTYSQEILDTTFIWKDHVNGVLKLEGNFGCLLHVTQNNNIWGMFTKMYPKVSGLSR